MNSPRTAAACLYGVPACRNGWDDVDRVLVDWAAQRPDLDFTPVGVVTRLSRVRTYLDAELAGVFASFGLTSADFLVIVSLRRAGKPYRMPQARLMDALGLTSGTVSVRLDRLEKNGIVTREPDPASARGSLVQLTVSGLELFDRVAPVHLANEDRLLSALSPAERQVLADLLRRLSPRSSRPPPTWPRPWASSWSPPGWRAPADRRSGCPTRPGCSSPRWSRAARRTPPGSSAGTC